MYCTSTYIVNFIRPSTFNIIVKGVSLLHNIFTLDEISNFCWCQIAVIVTNKDGKLQLGQNGKPK
jgi:hypothetical protein